MSQSDEPQSEYPEHEKLDTPAALALVSFLEHLQERDMFVAISDDKGLRLTHDTRPSAVLCEYLGVDVNKLEAERRDMLAKFSEIARLN
jgi:hypothetical protein